MCLHPKKILASSVLDLVMAKTGDDAVGRAASRFARPKVIGREKKEDEQEDELSALASVARRLRGSADVHTMDRKARAFWNFLGLKR